MRNGKSTDRKKSRSCNFHSNAYCFSHNEDSCYNHYPGSRNVVEIKQQCNGMALPLVTVPASEFSKENGVILASSPDPLEQLLKPFHQSNSSDSPCVLEAGSDIFSKREVIEKLRQQLKRRDDMILEMQDQNAELLNSLDVQLSRSSYLQLLLDAERDIQRIRKTIADHCVGHMGSSGNPPAFICGRPRQKEGMAMQMDIPRLKATSTLQKKGEEIGITLNC